MLRFVVGYHFYKEGTAKLKSKNFDAGGFLQSAKGPLAPYFHAMLDDEDGSKRFGVKVDPVASGPESVIVEPDQTFYIWEDFMDRAASHYHFGGDDVVDELKKQREVLAEEIRQRKAEDDPYRDLELQRAAAEQEIKQIRSQMVKAKEILDDSKSELLDWQNANRVKLIAYYGTREREKGFAQDGDNSESVALYVDTLRYQVDTIKSDRQKELYGWKAEVGNIWTAYEGRMNDLATDSQREEFGKIAVHKPFDQPTSPLKIINKVIPWFDTIVGVLLILGLFTRLASGAAALFLISVVLTQPFWIPGSQPTYFYWIELAALLVIFATCAGRIGGLDYFLHLASSGNKGEPKPVPVQPVTAPVASTAN